MKLLLLLLVGVAAMAQPPAPIPNGLSGIQYQAAVNQWLSFLYTGKVETIRKVNGHPLTADVTVTPTDLGLSHSVIIPIAGSPIATGTGSVGIPGSANFSCTINKAQISANASGSITVHVWKAAGSVPSSSDKISASAPVTLSSAQINQNSPLTGWATAVAAGDVFWATVATVDGSLTSAAVVLTCQ